MKKPKKNIQLFDNPLLEKLTRTNSAVVITILALISVTVFVYGAIFHELKLILMFAILLLGILFFTLAEYLIHRFVFHSGDYTNEQEWQFKMHGIHHATPSDKQRLAMPLPLSITLAALFFSIFWLVMGNYVFFFFPGFLLGYSFYLYVHYLIHTRRPPKKVFGFLWRHHHIHHFKNDREAYGVTTPLWDIIFRTMPIEKRSKQT